MNVNMYYQYMVLDGKCVRGYGFEGEGKYMRGGQEHLGSMSLHTNPLSTLPLVISLGMILVFL